VSLDVLQRDLRFAATVLRRRPFQCFLQVTNRCNMRSAGRCAAASTRRWAPAAACAAGSTWAYGCGLTNCRLRLSGMG